MGNIIPSLIPDDVTFKAEFGLNDKKKALHDGSLGKYQNIFDILIFDQNICLPQPPIFPREKSHSFIFSAFNSYDEKHVVDEKWLYTEYNEMIAAAQKYFVDLENDVTGNWKVILLLGTILLILILATSVCFVKQLLTSHKTLRKKVKEARSRPQNLHLNLADMGQPGQNPPAPPPPAV